MPSRTYTTTTTYSRVREHLAQIWNEIEDAQQPVVLQRRGHEDLALLPAAELASLQETAHLLRSPENAARLLTALARSRREKTIPSMALDELRVRLGVAATPATPAPSERAAGRRRRAK